ncbi:MAG TPA: hypothetical protein PLE99_00765 [Candidatus Thiothrix moscowensis]|uniref:hypothetical protein n=1 Tax=unclassified Thiothrix TaxID=2636184 RepID=UPI0025CC9CA0|nr:MULTISPECIES: hypothetical protein [unclassified Thiothrix]HRJ51267.1 hypothetical protein [Candidatus Thiothrix moscowensis]HRJ91678.1 hypothetical protein [Candidatus Thiothrix moscowensis]
MEPKSDVGNLWGMTDDEVEYYGKLSIQHQEYLPWLFVNYAEEAESNVGNIKKSISILRNRKENVKVWQDYYKWNMEHERAKHFLGASMSIYHLAMLIFPFLSQKQEYKVFCDAVVLMICNQSMQASSFPWQGEYYQLIEPYIDSKMLNALTDERSSIQLYSNLVDSGLKNLAKITHAEFIRATVKNWHLSKCADIWTSYLEYMAVHGALPSRLHFGVEYRGEKYEEKGKIKLAKNFNAQKTQILKEIEDQKLDVMNINLKQFKAKFLSDYKDMTDRMFMKAWWELSGEGRVRSDKTTIKRKPKKTS